MGQVITCTDNGFLQNVMLCFKGRILLKIGCKLLSYYKNRKVIECTNEKICFSLNYRMYTDP